MAPENKPAKKSKVIFQPSFFRGYVTLRGCRWFFYGFDPMVNSSPLIKPRPFVGDYFFSGTFSGHRRQANQRHTKKDSFHQG